MPNLSLQHANVLLMSMPVTCNDSQSAGVEAREINSCVFREVEGNRKTCLGGEKKNDTLQPRTSLVSMRKTSAVGTGFSEDEREP
jgi:hypothetical protein